ncbi:MAG: hypothetical protein COB07_08450 [Sulfurovum sp.]|nr:MAG: hypothetical protein COB07_08450 [Sulfurovum sp.]
MSYKCETCKHVNIDKALFCANCGSKINKVKPSNKNEIVVSVVLVVITAFIINYYMNRIEQGKIEVLEVEKNRIVQQKYDVENSKKQRNLEVEKNRIEQQKLEVENLKELSDSDIVAIIEVLNPQNLKMKKDTFETSDDYRRKKGQDLIRRQTILDEILSSHTSGTVSMRSYDADNERITLNITWTKSLSAYIDKDSFKVIDFKMSKDMAKELFLEGKRQNFWLHARIWKSLLAPTRLSLWYKNKKSLFDWSDIKMVDTLMYPDIEYGNSMTWYEAITYCENYTYGTYADWRLPRVEELSRLYKDNGKFSSHFYWSSTVRAGYSNDAWLIYFSDGIKYGGHKSKRYNVRCVRAGQ